MNPATRRAVLVRVAVVGTTLFVMLLIALTRGTGGAEATVDLARAQHAAVAAVMASVDPAAAPVRYSDVVDAATGRAYLEQTAASFMAADRGPVTGRFEFGLLPASSIADFHRNLGVTPGDWARSDAAKVRFMLWRASESAFQTPRPRAGMSTRVTGDTLVVLIDPGTGLETRAIVSYAETAALRNAMSQAATGELTIGGSG